MKILVISLAAAADRRRSAIRQLQELNLAFDFLDGVDGRAPGHPELERYDEQAFLVNCGRPGLPGELGCYASHFKAWQACVELGRPLLVLEDDFSLKPDFPQALAICSSLVERFGYIRMEITTRARGYTVWRNENFRLIKYVKMPQGALCYALTPAVAQALIRGSDRFRYPIDVFVRKSWRHKVPLFGLSPYSVVHGEISQQSNIGDRRSRPTRSLWMRLKRVGMKLYSLSRAGATNLLQATRRY